jgi:hypothetical protein
MIYLKWLLIMLANLFGFVTAPIVFPIAYLFKGVSFVRNYLLWLYYDDEDEFGYNVGWWMKGRERGFFTAYRWSALRNPAWNLQALWMLDYNDTFNIIRGNDRTCVLKYVDEDGNYMDNQGEYLSLKHSIIGSEFLLFNLNGKKYWRYSYAESPFGNIWFELQIGFTTRATFRFKIKNIKKIYYANN